MSTRKTPLPAGTGPVLVVAPHPDDETLGCGGLIAASVRDGRVVHTVFVTDGAASHPGSGAWSRRRLGEQREAEAKDALRRLGAAEQPTSFLRLPDAAMPPRGSPGYATASEAMAEIVEALEPELVVVPWRRDPHCDHRASWTLVMEVLAASRRSPEVLEYAIWLDELGQPDDWPRPGEVDAVSLPVSSEMKRHALLAHRSQLGELVHDDPTGFTLSPETIARLTGPEEVYWRRCNAE
jgi:LmbE family N-acetylglucosaminyl deacetylase